MKQENQDIQYGEIFEDNHKQMNTQLKTNYENREHMETNCS